VRSTAPTTAAANFEGTEAKGRLCGGAASLQPAQSRINTFVLLPQIV
jgi:hypothetical protein